MKNEKCNGLSTVEFLASPYKPHYFKEVPKEFRKRFVLALFREDEFESFLLTEERKYFISVCDEEIGLSEEDSNTKDWEKLKNAFVTAKNPIVFRGFNFLKLIEIRHEKQMLQFDDFTVPVKSIPNGVLTDSKGRLEDVKKSDIPYDLIRKFSRDARLEMAAELFEEVVKDYELRCFDTRGEYLITYNEIFLAEVQELLLRKGKSFECETSNTIRGVVLEAGRKEINCFSVQTLSENKLKISEIPDREIENPEDYKGWKFYNGPNFVGLLPKYSDEALESSVDKLVQYVEVGTYSMFLLTLLVKRNSAVRVSRTMDSASI